MVFEHGGHSLFSYESKSSFVDRMVSTIETGTNGFASSSLSFYGFASLASFMLATLF